MSGTSTCWLSSYIVYIKDIIYETLEVEKVMLPTEYLLMTINNVIKKEILQEINIQ